MRGRWTLAVVALAALLVALALGLFYLLLEALRAHGTVFAEAWRLTFAPPHSAEQVLDALAVVLLLVAGLVTPLAALETRALRAFARREEELRRERPLDAVTPYAGAEGEGVAFDGPDGRLLLLRPPQGIGRPREVVVAPAPAPPA